MTVHQVQLFLQMIAIPFANTTETHSYGSSATSVLFCFPLVMLLNHFALLYLSNGNCISVIFFSP